MRSKSLAMATAVAVAATMLVALPFRPASADNSGTAHHPRAGIAVNPSGEVALGSSVLVTATITDQHVAGHRYNEGTVYLEYKQGGPTYTVFGSGTPNANGELAASLSVTDPPFVLTVGLDGLPDTDDDKPLNIRARYDHPTFNDDTSSVLELDVVEAECTAGVHISEPAVTGTGSPSPGSSETWTFAVEVKNCTGVALTGVKVQGGTSGWTSLDGAPSATLDPAPTIKQNKKTAIISWTGDLADGQAVVITVPVKGTVGSTCGAIQHLSGNWSAAYQITEPGSPPVTTKYKTDYTGRATIQVTCPE